MFDLRYHVASLAAVFVALLIGILVGVGLTGKVDDAEKNELASPRRSGREPAAVNQRAAGERQPREHCVAQARQCSDTRS